MVDYKEDIKMYRNYRTKNFLATLIAGAVLIVGAEISQAATYWVSNTGAATWANCSGATPLSGTAACPVQTAFDNAVAGDVVNFRGGTYSVPAKNFSTSYHGYYEPAHSGTSGNPITFQAYTGETPLFNGTAGGSGDNSDYATVFGTNGINYITFDGFHFQSDNGTKMARIFIGGDDPSSIPSMPDAHTSIGIVLKNCDINGGSTAILTGDNRENVRINNAISILVQKCKIYNARSTFGYPGINAIKSYFGTYVTVENNEIYNTEEAVYLKSDTDHWIIRNNWIHDNNVAGISVTPYYTSATHNATNHTIYNNVIANSTGGISVYTDDNSAQGPANADNMTVYNNTVYNIGGIGLNFTGTRNFTMYNNIVQGFSGNQLYFGYSYYSIAESDYNNFGSSSLQILTHKYQGNQATYTTLAAWRATTDVIGGLHPDTHSIASNPLFQNGSGLLKQLNDFQLANNSPSKGTGQGGADMGADVASVGTGVTPISPPTNLRVQ
jgi:hypothetical protein